MKELVIISGKGGTGKTSLVASLAVLAKKVVLADCDVDAADLHLVLEPEIIKSEDFSGGFRASVIPEKCTACGKCQDVCRFAAISQNEYPAKASKALYQVDPLACEGCGVCYECCPQQAIDFSPVTNGQWHESRTRVGTMVHAQLKPGEENSGKLVSLVRRRARAIAKEENSKLVLIDGSPGIGCPVIASITGADLVLVVTEPTLSGLHDLDRIADLIEHFKLPAMVCVNKWDINPEATRHIMTLAEKRKLSIAGNIRYDQIMNQAQVNRQAVVEIAQQGIAQDINELWGYVAKTLGN